MAGRRAAYFVGQVIQRGVGRPETVKVRTKKLVLDKYLTKVSISTGIWRFMNKSMKKTLQKNITSNVPYVYSVYI